MKTSHTGLDVLAIGAHPDDIELSCGGTVLKLIKRGYAVGIADITDGELGTRGSREVRAKEAREAARLLGVTTRVNLGIPDGNIENSEANRLRLIRVIREYRPQVLLIPYSIDRHPDHEHAHVLCREACYYAGLRMIVTDKDGKKQEPHRPRAFYQFMQWFQFTPSFTVDISDEFEQRMKAARAFKSQFYDPESTEPETTLSRPEFLDIIAARLAYFGNRIGKRYGEPFFSAQPLKINDLVELNS